MTQVCKLCARDDRPIRNSHTIPKAVFKSLHSSDGKHVSYKISENRFNEKAQDQGDELMLCDICEEHLISKFENYSLRILREQYTAPDGNKLYWRNVDLHTVNMYCLSVLWRSMASGHELYKRIPNVPFVVDYYRSYILNNTAISRPKFAVRISRLDPRPLGLPDNFMVGPIIEPTMANLPINGTVFRFVYWGYLFEKYPCSFKHSASDRSGIVMKNKRYMHIPDTDIRSHDFIMNLIAKAEQRLTNS